ncbi:MAG: PAS domain S-box protein [Anaerolineae bacterium]
MRHLRENLLVQFSIVSLVIMLILAVGVSKILSDRLNYNMELLKAYGAARMAGIIIKDTDPMSIPSLTREVRNLRWITLGVVGGSFAILYGSLVYIVWGGWRTIRRQQAALVKTNVDLQTLQESSPDSIIATNAEGRIVVFNPGAEELLGYRAAEMLGQPAQQVYPSLEVAQAIMQSMRADPKGYVRNLETTLRHKDGREIPVLISAAILRGADGQEQGTVGYSKDLTESKRTEEALRKAHTQTEQLLTSISSIVIGAGPDERITRWNETTEATFGIAAADVLGRPFLECGIRWDWMEVVEAVAECRQQNRPIRLDNLRYTRPDGKEGFLDITFNPIMGGADRQAGFLLLARDVTERKVLEGQLIQAQKLESIGQLAAGIAHEINTPIQFVGDNTRFLGDAFADLAALLEQYDDLQERCQMGQPVEPELQRITEVQETVDLGYLLEEVPTAIDQTLDGVHRVARIVQAMKDFSHPDVQGKQVADLNRALESTLTIARNELKYIADVEIDLDPDLPPVFCQVDEINQAFLNLLINARDAIADAASDRRNGMGKITVTSRREGDQVVIGVTDTGTGIPEEIRDRIFDPFFTTKEVGRGTGQGLSIAYSVVEKHGGSLAFETEVDKGTTFFVHLPVQ